MSIEDAWDELERRFWSKVERGGPDECWPWLASTQPDGYGQIKVAGRSSMVRAHRLAWELTNGPIPEGLCVCHSCDNPPCCNPAHLWLGTKGDNNRDMTAKGRHGRTGTPGEAHPSSVLTTVQVQEIRSRYSGAYGEVSALARSFGVSRRLIRRIVTREAWAHVD